MRSMILSCVLVVSACGSDAEVESCEPANACECTDGIERDTACVCVGGSTCSIEGDDIEFACDGNADCSLECGTNCLITCPGTTSCAVVAGDDAQVSCPGTASCDITCLGDCEVEVAGAATAVVRCEGEPDGATCSLAGCSPTDCGDGVSVCGTGCP